ncbi:MAG TPA: UvrD-helicase domain-containing protein [Nocardioidaceae bacterium]|nr:UvrD-helicase domain-containing protein [Nocardioidaceae bacterium]
MTVENDAQVLFDLAGPLPPDRATTVLEASAGTGKTHAIATLATRYVAEGLPLEELMLVTFGRAATSELRERVRSRMVETAAALATPAATLQDDDPVLRLLASGSELDVATRRTRLLAALARFDAATIATTHQFCGQMLRALGIAADVDPDTRFVDTASEVVDEAVTDLYVRAFGQPGSGPAPFGFDLASKIAHTASGDPSATLAPADAEPGSEAHRRFKLAEAVRAEVARRKRVGRIQDYDDLLVQLLEALVDPACGAAAREMIRRRYSVVMVDEFQDTDPVQWQILSQTFDGETTLVLIGDPKQAIYAFRGADVQTYLGAAASAGSLRTLGVNWRADSTLLAALEPLLGGVTLGDDRITVGPVTAHHAGSRVQGLPGGAPLRIRVVDRDHVRPVAGKKAPSAGMVQPYVARDAAADIVRLLESGATCAGDPIVPGDIAVLVQTGYQGQLVRDALSAAGVPVVLTGTSSVFAGQAAQDWLTLLSAIEQPHRPGLVRAAALTPFVGWTATELAEASEEKLDRHAARLRGWADVLRDQGVAALLEAAARTGGVAGRILAEEGGERLLTDLRHIGQMLHAEVTRKGLRAAALVGWLRERIADAAVDLDQERSRRLDSDAKAVQVTTVHTAKGLEFPVVYAPFLWWRMEPWGAEEVLLLHDSVGRRVRDVGGPSGPGYASRRSRHDQEAIDESLRLAYVALTRASSALVTWWAPTWHTRRAPLHRLLFRPEGHVGPLPLEVFVPTDDAVIRERLDAFAAGHPGSISVETAAFEPGVRWTPPVTSPSGLDVRRLTRSLDLDWTRTSYSGLTAGLHELPGPHGLPGVASEPEAPGTVDEPELEVVGHAAPDGAMLSPMADLPVGAAFGTLVHSVLETVDFAASDLRAALVERCVAEGSERFAGVPAEELADALLPALLTPLGPLADGRRLADFRAVDVLAEMEYEYPLAGGDHPRPHATVDQIGDLLERHLPEGDPMRSYAAALAVDALRGTPLKGFIGGFLDVILRVRDADGTPRYLVVDYKTNWLGATAAPREQLSSWDYRPEALARAMQAAHYPLQALLYAVAVHRFLRWRQPGYDPETHLGGVLYLFLRGMCGPDTPVSDGVPAGVFSWRPPAQLVVELSELLDGARG